MSPHKREPYNELDLDPDSFGAQLRRIRKERGLSQGELGAAIGANQARISAYEMGRNVPNEEMMLQLAEALNVPPFLFFEAGHFGGALPVGPEMRKHLQKMEPRELRLFEQAMAVMGEVTPEQRAQFEKGFASFLETWHKS